MTIWRTDADLRCWDPSIDPSDRKLGSVWGKDPFATNYGAVGFARFCTPEAWLSTWSGHSSRANLFETAKAVQQPCLLIDYTGDNTVFPADCTAIFDTIASANENPSALPRRPSRPRAGKGRGAGAGRRRESDRRNG